MKPKREHHEISSGIGVNDRRRTVLLSALR